jgi:CHAT domain-containing protein
MKRERKALPGGFMSRFLAWIVCLHLIFFPLTALADEFERFVQQGDERFNQGDFSQALQLYSKAGKLAKERDDKKALCELINNVAAVYMATDDLDNFHRYFAAARDCKRDKQQVQPVAVHEVGVNMLKNGGFEDGFFFPWGTGHYESSAGKTRFGIWWNSNNAKAFMKIDIDQKHSGKKSLRITNFSKSAPHVFTTTSQRITGLKPNTVYRISLWARAEGLQSSAVFIAIDPAWTKILLRLPGGDHDWKHFTEVVNSGHNDFIDVRIVHTGLGTVWLDDIEVSPAKIEGGPQDLMAEAASLYGQARFQDALKIYEKMVKDYAEQKGLITQVHRRMGLIYLALGRYQEARDIFNRLADDNYVTASMDLGDLYSQLGEFDKAVRLYEKAVIDYKEDQGTRSLVLDKLAGSYMALGQLDQALNAQKRSLHILRHIGDRHGEAKALNTLGLIQIRKGLLKDAAASLTDAEKLTRELDDPYLLTRVLTNRGEARFQMNQGESARKDATDALTITNDIGDQRGKINSLWLRGRIFRQMGKTTDALADLEEAVRLLNRLYEGLDVSAHETRAAFLKQFTELYREYTDLLLELHEKEPGSSYDRKAFTTAEMARARMFTEMISEVRAARSLTETATDPDFQKLLKQERLARAELEAVRWKRDQYLEQPRERIDQKQLSALEESLNRAEKIYQKAAMELAKSFPRWDDLKAPKPITIKDIQQVLNPNEAVLCYFLTDNRTGIWAIDRNRMKLAVLPFGRQALADRTGGVIKSLSGLGPAMVRFFRSSKNKREQAKLREAIQAYDLKQARECFRTLVEPGAEIIKGKETVFLAPDGFLYQLPFEVLVTKPVSGDGITWKTAPFWVKETNLSYLPSVSVLRSLRTLSKAGTGDRDPLVAFADPIFEGKETTGVETRGAILKRLRSTGAVPEGGLARLPETADEAKEAARALGGSENDLYLQERATESNVKKAPLRRYKTILFATHGLMAGEFRPGVQPALVLSFSGDPENDGLLEMSEILGLDLRADLVVLSACNTAGGSGGKDRGEGFAGLTRSFMYAGTDSLAVTLWSVESQSAATLMGDFYRGLNDKPRSEALSEAKRAMISQADPVRITPDIVITRAHPFFWAPFILVGDTRQAH